MNEQEEKARWMKILEDLQEAMPIARIAEHLGVEERVVWRWKAGDRRPMGMIAVQIYLLHVKSCPERQCPVGHYAMEK